MCKSRCVKRAQYGPARNARAASVAMTVGPVLHVDVDAFFCQVEQLKAPELQGKAVAIQQHQDIISVNYPARAAGVVKHMPVHQVHCEDGFRVSYRPYREMSNALIRLLKRFPSAAVVQKASIDEAFIACHPPGTGDPWRAAEQLGADIREAARRELGLVVSVGIAANPLLAKLSSTQSKPDGLKLVSTEEATQQLLQATDIKRLPGMGGRVADVLLRAGLRNVWALHTFTPQELVAATGSAISLQVAEKLVESSHGRDATPVVDKGPPKSIQVQMTLTPVPLPAPHGRQMPVAGGQQGMLMPLLAGATDSFARIQQLLRAMASDVASRVQLDRQLEGRWPSKLSLQFISHGPQGRTTSRSCVFPSVAVLEQLSAGLSEGEGAGTSAPREPAAAAVIPAGADQSLMVGERAMGVDPALLTAVCKAADGMAMVMLPLHAPSAPLVQVHVAVSGFQPVQAAAASRNIAQFFRPRTTPECDPGGQVHAPPSRDGPQRQMEAPWQSRSDMPALAAAVQQDQDSSRVTKKQRVGSADDPGAAAGFGLQPRHAPKASDPAPARQRVNQQRTASMPARGGPLALLPLLQTLPVGPDGGTAWREAGELLDARLHALGLSRCLL